MPKDEDILQLVSPSVCTEGPCGSKEKETARHCSTGPSRPIPGLGLLLLHSSLLCVERGGSGLGEQDSCQGI